MLFTASAMRSCLTSVVLLLGVALQTHAQQCLNPLGDGAADAAAPFWLQDIRHQGTSAFNANPGSYKVFRNVKDYGARGDGVTDDTAAINSAIADQNRCGQGCKSSTLVPGLIYFPPGTYLVSSPIVPFYYTSLVGDAKNRPILLASANFQGIAVIDADPYIPGGGGAQYWVNQNNFFRSTRNFLIDLRQMPVASTATGLHWQVSQATSLVNVRVEMSQDAATNHQGIFMENGSGGMLSDIEFNGGRFGIWVGNQQFTVRNIKVTNSKTAVFAIWNWGWTWQNVQISNCKIGFEITTGGLTQETQTVGSEVIIDAVVSDTPVFIQTSTTSTKLAGSILLDNVKLNNVPVAVQDATGHVLLAGGTVTITQWAQGNVYSGTSSTGQFVQAALQAPSKPAALLDGSGSIFSKPRPQYENFSVDQFVSVKTEGAKGDGVTDDTAALQAVFDKYSGCKIIFIDAGTYRISSTLHIPVGTKVVGELWSVILLNGSAFNDVNNPTVGVQVGKEGDVGSVEISDLVFSTVAGSAGAIVLQINVKQDSQGSVGVWDTHVRLGGFIGTGMNVAECGKLNGHGAECAAAFLALHITKGASAYLENLWAWTADHSLDDPAEGQIDVFTARGILSESEQGPVWMIGTGSEHAVLYQYSIVSSHNVYAGLIQTETPYYQPSPAPPSPFPTNPNWNDPATTSDALALSVQGSSDIFVYGAGLYSFFVSYTQDCLKTVDCQKQIANVDSASSNVHVYGLSTVGTTFMLSVDGNGVIPQSANINGFASTATAWSLNGSNKDEGGGYYDKRRDISRWQSRVRSS